MIRILVERTFVPVTMSEARLRFWCEKYGVDLDHEDAWSFLVCHAARGALFHVGGVRESWRKWVAAHAARKGRE